MHVASQAGRALLFRCLIVAYYIHPPGSILQSEAVESGRPLRRIEYWQSRRDRAKLRTYRTGWLQAKPKGASRKSPADSKPPWPRSLSLAGFLGRNPTQTTLPHTLPAHQQPQLPASQQYYRPSTQGQQQPHARPAAAVGVVPSQAVGLFVLGGRGRRQQQQQQQRRRDSPVATQGAAGGEIEAAEGARGARTARTARAAEAARAVIGREDGKEGRRSKWGRSN